MIELQVHSWKCVHGLGTVNIFLACWRFVNLQDYLIIIFSELWISAFLFTIVFRFIPIVCAIATTTLKLCDGEKNPQNCRSLSPELDSPFIIYISMIVCVWMLFLILRTWPGTDTSRQKKILFFHLRLVIHNYSLHFVIPRKNDLMAHIYPGRVILSRLPVG